MRNQLRTLKDRMEAYRAQVEGTGLFDDPAEQLQHDVTWRGFDVPHRLIGGGGHCARGPSALTSWPPWKLWKASAAPRSSTSS